jgi:hypothetical protein
MTAITPQKPISMSRRTTTAATPGNDQGSSGDRAAKGEDDAAGNGGQKPARTPTNSGEPVQDYVTAPALEWAGCHYSTRTCTSRKWSSMVMRPFSTNCNRRQPPSSIVSVSADDDG